MRNSDVDNTEKVLKALSKASLRTVMIIGGMMEANAKIEITKSVYDTPRSSWYKRTGALRNSITHRVEGDGGSVIVGSNLEYAP